MATEEAPGLGLWLVCVTPEEAPGLGNGHPWCDKVVELLFWWKLQDQVGVKTYPGVSV